MGVLFRVNDPQGNEAFPPLSLRLSPTSVQWTYNLNTRMDNTFGGQVIQILSINFDKLIIEGRFGREGPHGIEQRPGSDSLNRFINNNLGKWQPRQGSDIWNYNQSTTSSTIEQLKIGISQMTEWFRQYFSFASQGYSRGNSQRFKQFPIIVSYDGGFDGALEGTGAITERHWTVYPIDFPSYSRAIDEFTPEWHIEFEIEEADYQIKVDTLQADLNNIKSGVGYTPFNPFSDPAAATLPRDVAAHINKIKDSQQAIQDYNNVIDSVFDHYGQFLGNMSASDIQDLLYSGASVPNVLINQSLNQAQKSTQKQNQIGGIRTDPTIQPTHPGTNP